jgi:4-amino-4-deoxy-L-arabinose transferase-like glycosyltransferase
MSDEQPPPVNGPARGSSNPARMRLGLPAVLLVAAALRLWRLDQNGFGNEYYGAGVRSMSLGWHNFLYHAFDPAGFISVDKPPVAMWIQVASVKLLGFHGPSVLLPQALEGLAAVALLYHLVRRRFGEPAGLLAALLLAVTPVSVAVDRSSNTESCLVLVLLLAAWALTRAVEDGSRRWLLLSMALVGLGFNVKMLAAFVVLPTFGLVYALGAAVPVRRRLVDLSLGALVLAAVSLSWVLVYDLTPPERRPYAGTTDRNSVLELAVGPYGIGRFVRQTRPSATTDAPPAPAPVVADAAPRTGPARLFVRTPVGPLRLADGQLAGQVAWLLPLAAAGLVLAALAEPSRRPPAPAHLALALWAGWALTYGAVYSYAGGFFHFYYLSTLAPPLAALAALGVVGVWRAYRAGGRAVVLAPALLVLTGVWQLFVDRRALEGIEGGPSWLHGILLGGVALAAAALALLALRRAGSRPAAVALAVGLAALLVVPTAWALSSVLVPGNGALPSADRARLVVADRETETPSGGRRAPRDIARLIAFLLANRQGERYVLATSTTMLAAPIIIQTGEPVMARGGFHGLDPILTPDRLAALVAARQVRFVMLGDLSFVSRRLRADVAGRPIADWVRANCRLVDPMLWRTAAPEGRRGMRLYDLRPGDGLVAGADGGGSPLAREER